MATQKTEMAVILRVSKKSVATEGWTTGKNVMMAILTTMTVVTQNASSNSVETESLKASKLVMTVIMITVMAVLLFAPLRQSLLSVETTKKMMLNNAMTGTLFRVMAAMKYARKRNAAMAE